MLCGIGCAPQTRWEITILRNREGMHAAAPVKFGAWSDKLVCFRSHFFFLPPSRLAVSPRDAFFIFLLHRSRATLVIPACRRPRMSMDELRFPSWQTNLLFQTGRGRINQLNVFWFGARIEERAPASPLVQPTFHRKLSCCLENKVGFEGDREDQTARCVLSQAH